MRHLGEIWDLTLPFPTANIHGDHRDESGTSQWTKAQRWPPAACGHTCQWTGTYTAHSPYDQTKWWRKCAPQALY